MPLDDDVDDAKKDLDEIRDPAYELRLNKPYSYS
jgi:hypothetical protein